MRVSGVDADLEVRRRAISARRASSAIDRGSRTLLGTEAVCDTLSLRAWSAADRSVSEDTPTAGPGNDKVRWPTQPNGVLLSRYRYHVPHVPPTVGTLPVGSLLGSYSQY